MEFLARPKLRFANNVIRRNVNVTEHRAGGLGLAPLRNTKQD
jgi:hypothetical protein